MSERQQKSEATELQQIVVQKSGQSEPHGSISSENEITEHMLTPEQVLAKFNTKFNFENPMKSFGLSQEKVEALRKIHGDNVLTPPKQISWTLVFLKKLTNLFTIFLLLSSLALLIVYFFDLSQLPNLFLAIVFFVISIVNTTIDFVQEYKSAALLESFKNLIPLSAQVFRDGIRKEISAAELVPGDIVLIRTGDKAPADVRLLWIVDMKVDNSSITGESEPQDRNLVAGTDYALDAANLVFNGSLVVVGEGMGVVIKTGDKTTLGQISSLAVSEVRRENQMAQEIQMYIRKLSVVAFVVTVALLIVALARGFTVINCVSFAVSLFISFIPEGLPVTLTTMLMITAKRMAKLNVLVKDLQGVETLGSITLLATDKTGTLTQNRMTMVGCWLNDTLHSITGYHEAHDQGQVEIPLKTDTPNFMKIIEICLLCSKARYDAEDPIENLDEKRVMGDATETGLLRFASHHVPKLDEYVDSHGKVCEIPFSSVTKWNLVICKLAHATGSYTLLIKGAPERIMKMCGSVLVNDQKLQWSEEWEKRFFAAYEHFAKQGQRVLAFARLELPGTEFPDGFTFQKDPANFPLNGFTFTGLVSLMDPPKKGVRKAVSALRTAGIQVVMVTGDHPLTAEAIARKIGLITGETKAEVAKKLNKPIEAVTDDQYSTIIIHGDRIDSMTDQDWDIALSKKEIVFARTSPKHKLTIVKRSQAKGHIVGVSGDGVNDSPALKKADLGISMNKTGSDVSKDAAAMILLDDNFETIVTGISQGRLTFANIKKSIRYTVTHTMPELIPRALYACLLMPAPVSAMLLVMVDLGSELAPAMSYAYEVPESDLMRISPRKVLCTPDQNYITFQREMQLHEETASNIIVKLWHNVKNAFRSQFTGETLVDSDLIFWAYFQAGIIEAAGCMAAYLVAMAIFRVPFNLLVNTADTYFQSGAPSITLTDGTIADATYQAYILSSAQTAYYLSIVICQIFNLYVNKHRYDFPWGRDYLKNYQMVFGILIGAGVAAIVSFIPSIQFFFGSAAPPALALLCPVGAGIVLYIYEIIRRSLHMKGYLGGMPKKNTIEFVRTVTSAPTN